MSDDNDPMGMIARLRDRAADVAGDLGLELLGFFVVPAEEGVPPRAQVVFSLDPDVAFADVETREMRRTFDQMMRAESDTDEVEKVRAARDTLATQLKGLKSDDGLGFDDE